MGSILRREYEVCTIFVRSSADLARLRPDHLRAWLRGQNVVSWYFLWPNTDGPAGYVSEREFFRFVGSMERLPIRTVWPHESSLYRVLCGKLWIPQMCLNKDFSVPPTTRIHYAEFKRDSHKAAEKALDVLMRLRKRLWNWERVHFEDFKGVVKLGFSWCGSDVLPFHGLNSLVSNVRKISENRECENTVCLVQEMILGVVGEHRILCMYDRDAGRFWKESVWMESMRPCSADLKHDIPCVDVPEFIVAGAKFIRPGSVAASCFQLEEAAKSLAEQKADRVVDLWLQQWYRTESTEPPHCTRIDFLATHPNHGEVDIWTCEVGECGASLCGVEVHGRNLCALNNAILRDDDRRGFPRPFPPKIPRNSGSKS